MLKENSLYYNVTPEADGLYHCPFAFDPAAGCKHKPVFLESHYRRFVDSHLKALSVRTKAANRLDLDPKVAFANMSIKNILCTETVRNFVPLRAAISLRLGKAFCTHRV
ncbi:hypothetical protein DL98DRAFT_317503 [Cadophora sp. DSE1049]|nr:hypothetical protein DL98DRAFT_317503 [Cadophora sp. DSE1049]